MNRILLSLFLFISVIPISVKADGSVSEDCQTRIIDDSLTGNQILNNGRIWRNYYLNKVKGDQFLFSDKFLAGSVRMNGREFKNLHLRYDIHNDQIMIITSNNNILQLNKEMVEKFSLQFNNRIHDFIKMENDSVIGVNGYVEVLYEGASCLFIKHEKVIERLKEGRILDNFIQEKKIFIVKSNLTGLIRKKKDLLKTLGDHKQQVKNYIKANRLKVIQEDPGDIVAILKFYDTLSR